MQQRRLNANRNQTIIAAGIIGDSLAAGAGSSGSWKTDKVILCDGEENFMRRIAPNSWWGSFETYLKDKFPGCTLENNGCGGASSGQLRNGIEQLFCEDRDDIIFLFFGANDRKRENGMQELRDNLSWMIRFFREKGKEMVVFTPTPSTVMNEAYVNRLYHMEDVANIIIDVAEKEGVILADKIVSLLLAAAMTAVILQMLHNFSYTVIS